MIAYSWQGEEGLQSGYKVRINMLAIAVKIWKTSIVVLYPYLSPIYPKIGNIIN
jgi:hypothetical protein